MATVRALFLALLVLALPAAACAGSALSGAVRTTAEGPMEGVLVSAHAAGSVITITVATDAQGHYEFPAERLAPGDYSLTIRALGYRLSRACIAHVATDGETHQDLDLEPISDITGQMTNAEWFASMPGTLEDKRPLIECMSCHTLERIVKSTYTADQWIDIFKRMANYANNTTQAQVQRRVVEREVREDRMRKVGAYLASVNRSRSPSWPWSLKTLPRPNGAATHMLVTEYDLPRSTIAPHDVRTDADGMIWYSNFSEPFLGRLDPRTGAHREYAYPLLKPDQPTGSLDLEPDEDGNLWLALMFQGGLARFDRKSETFKLFPVPPELNNAATQQSMVMPWRSHRDGYVWTNDVARQSVMRVDLATGRYELIDPFKSLPRGGSHSPYGLAADDDNNLWFMDFGDENIVKIDARTLAATIFPTPTRASRPRRVMFDGQRLWFASFAANKLGMFDIKAETFKEWDAPTPHSYPYDAFLDKEGMLWSGNMASDRILRMNPQTGAAVEYLLPRPTNVRRIFVDNTTTPPTLWAGSNHGASIVRLELR